VFLSRIRSVCEKALQASHYGLITRSRRDHHLRRWRLIRQVYGSVFLIAVLMLRFDAVENNETWKQACEVAGEPDLSVLLGEKRSAFSPPVMNRA
jgi:hypothetical protein